MSDSTILRFQMHDYFQQKSYNPHALYFPCSDLKGYEVLCVQRSDCREYGEMVVACQMVLFVTYFGL